MAADEQRPPFFSFEQTKKSQCRSLINNIYHNFKTSFCFFLVSSLFICLKNKNMASNNDTSDKKVLTLAEIQQLADDKDKCILMINNHIYDVTKFIDEVCNYIIE
jgi:cytochrome b involved in lipid metabolism